MKSLFSLFEKTHKRIYLDYASITPIDPRVLRHVTKVVEKYPANPGSLYKEGVEAHTHIEKSRDEVAKILDVHADEIVFTSGGTESNNLAIEGVLKAWKYMQSKTHAPEYSKPHIVSTTIEHPAVREILLRYQERGECDVTFVSVLENGIIDTKELKLALKPETILVSIMYVNNEIGTIQPIHEVSKIVRQYKKELGRAVYGAHAYPYVHTDACQAVLFCPLRVPTLGVDMMTLDSAKFYGPRSTGALYIRRQTSVEPLMIGGSQEFGMRAGTENCAQISGFAYALRLAVDEQEKEFNRVHRLHTYMITHLKKIQRVRFNGSLKIDSYKKTERIPSNINICKEGLDAEYAVLRLDAKGVAVSSVTSCRSKNEDSSSYVVEELSDTDCGKSSLRITIGRYTSFSDVKKALEILKKVLE